MEPPVDIVTIENFEQKLPRWDPEAPNHRYALVDMGSNGIRFSVSDLTPPRARLLKCLYKERAAISLFDALNEASPTGHGDHPLVFPDATIKLVSQTLARFRSIAVDSYDVPPGQVLVFATEAMRRAQNAAAMLDAIRSESPDLVVHILAPAVETLFGAVGALSSFVDVKGLLLDLGGGSVQMTYMDTRAFKAHGQPNRPSHEIEAALSGQSLPFGAARLIKILDNAHPDVQASEKSRLQTGMSDAFRTLCGRFPSLAATAEEAHSKKTAKDSPGIDLFLCGGGFRGYGSMLMHTDPIQPYPIPSIGSYTVSGERFRSLTNGFGFGDEKIFGISKRRRSQFPAIVAVVEALIAAVPPIRSVTFCLGGNREGALMMMLPPSIRDSSPLVLPDERDSTTHLNGAILQDMLDTLASAFPSDIALGNTTTVFGLGLGPLYASHIWERMGENAESNASNSLHSAINHPSSPGLTHLARAVLGITLCARWGANLGPIDHTLHKNLRELADKADPDATFWADYTGAVTAALASVVQAWPKTQDSIKEAITFRSSLEKGKRSQLHLEICISEKTSRGLDLEDIVGLFRRVGKHNDDKKKVKVTVNTVP
ncbi:Ppx/GppA phosphatase family-domain-containing protein [Podospora australis]|uniref:Ppx/GppA phosphatase family-domain-containing protein n=1 Tax=Podospora australis TaxID=1536484 RepID=A0AAN6X5P4_9PEZI|nr:Ppx/GppA phosphatase family-domain-containing protein [Podospora australis]